MAWSALPAVVFWGASFVAAKIALEEMSPLNLVLVRAVLASVALCVILGLRREWRSASSLSRVEWARLVVLAFVSVFAHQLAQMAGLRRTTAINSSLLVTLGPVFMYILSVLFLREGVTMLKAVGFLMALSGSALVVTGGDFGELWHQADTLAGDLLVVVSALGWAVYSILSKDLVRKHSPSVVVGLVFVLSVPILSAVTAIGGGATVSDLRGMTWRAWGAVAFLAWLCSALGYTLWYRALQRHHVSGVGVLQYLQPLVTAVLGILMLGETLTGATVAGGCMVLGGVALVGQRER